jgi:hypothetical protein
MYAVPLVGVAKTWLPGQLTGKYQGLSRLSSLVGGIVGREQDVAVEQVFVNSKGLGKVCMACPS